MNPDASTIADGNTPAHSMSHPHGHTLHAPRHYETFANFFFFGRRRATFEALVAAAGVRPGQRVLDVGCGTGYFARLLGQAVGPPGQVVGIDPSQEMIAYANGKASRARNNGQFQVGTVESLAFPAGYFDVVVSSLVMHHLPVDLHLPALREMRRVLRPGGTLLVADAQRPRQRLWRLLTAIIRHDRMARMVPDLEALAVQAEFEDIRTGEVAPWLRYVRAVAAPLTEPPRAVSCSL